MIKKLKNKKIFLLFPLIIFFFFVFFLQPSLAQIEFIPQIGVPDFAEAGKPVDVAPGTFAAYLSAFYKWSVVALAVLAVIMIMIAGLRWIFAAGNPQAIKQSQDQLFSALIGLILILIAVPLLQMINPTLVTLSALQIPEIKGLKEDVIGTTGDTEIELKLYLVNDPTNYQAPVEESSDIFCVYQRDGVQGSSTFRNSSRGLWADLYFSDNETNKNIGIKARLDFPSGMSMRCCQYDLPTGGSCRNAAHGPVGPHMWSLQTQKDQDCPKALITEENKGKCGLVKAFTTLFFPNPSRTDPMQSINRGCYFSDKHGTIISPSPTGYKINPEYGDHKLIVEFYEIDGDEEKFVDSKIYVFFHSCGDGLFKKELPCGVGTGGPPYHQCCVVKKDTGFGSYWPHYRAVRSPTPDLKCQTCGREWEKNYIDKIYCLGWGGDWQ